MTILNVLQLMDRWWFMSTAIKCVTWWLFISHKKSGSTDIFLIYTYSFWPCLCLWLSQCYVFEGVKCHPTVLFVLADGVGRGNVPRNCKGVTWVCLAWYALVKYPVLLQWCMSECMRTIYSTWYICVWSSSTPTTGCSIVCYLGCS